MADILIRGVEMPNTCFDCDILSHCKHRDYAYSYNFSKRPPGCPTAQLPEGHGRLIDADELAEDLQFDVEYDQRALDDLNFVGKERERIQFDKDCKQNCMWYLSNCHTIVPAEGGGE